MKELDECTATHVVAAFDPRLDGMSLRYPFFLPSKPVLTSSIDHNGAYLEDGDLVGKGVLRSTASKAEDAEKLWKLSEELVGEKFQY